MPRLQVALLHLSTELTSGLIARGVDVNGKKVAAVVIGIRFDHELVALSSSYTGVPVVALVPRELTNDNARRALCAVELGATAVLPIDICATELANALEVLVGGGSVADPFASQLLIKAVRARATARAAVAITTRERDVLTLLVEGHTTADIAKALGIGVTTAQTHMKNLYRKLDVSSKAQATAIALRQYLV